MALQIYIRLVLTCAVVSMASISIASPPPGKGNSSAPGQSNSSPGNSSPSNSNPGNSSSGNSNSGYLWQGNSDQLVNTLVTAGITSVLARNFAVGAAYTGFKPLPPGIAKNLARGKPLPPGIVTRSLPDNLLKNLPKYPGYNWAAAGADIILINTASRLVADVLRDALR
jgi:hypothetical protein